jgi:hypothetical protein
MRSPDLTDFRIDYSSGEVEDSIFVIIDPRVEVTVERVAPHTTFDTPPSHEREVPLTRESR